MLSTEPAAPVVPPVAVVPAGPILAPAYAGLITRAIAFAIDAALILAVQLLVSVAGVVIVGVLHLPTTVDAILAILGGCLAIVWAVGYHVAFWTTTGQTPGSRVMQIRVQAGDGSLLRPARALLRCAGLVLAAVPLFAGFLPILFDRRRRGFPDWLAQTLVLHTPQLSIAAARRAPVSRAPRATAPPR